MEGGPRAWAVLCGGPRHGLMAEDQGAVSSAAANCLLSSYE